MLLRVNDLHCSYNKISVVSGINFEIDKGIVCIIGSNGAGKSTLLKSLSGHLTPAKGNIFFENNDITYIKSWQLFNMGLVLVPEGRHLFGGLPVEENLWLGTFASRMKLGKENIKREIGFAYDLFPVLEKRKRQLAKTLSGGEQQMLAVGRGLVSQPKLLLLDEPSLGLAPLVKKEIFGTFLKMHKSKFITILLVEQDVRSALSISDRAYLMQTGKFVLEGDSKTIFEAPFVQEIYLGHKYGT